MLTWDLGAGPRRIFTKRPVDERYFVHSVQFGRYGRLGYLQVDNFPNITGRAPGLRENLNITSKVKMSIFIIWRISESISYSILENKEMVFKTGLLNIQAAGYNGMLKFKCVFTLFRVEKRVKKSFKYVCIFLMNQEVFFKKKSLDIRKYFLLT